MTDLVLVIQKSHTQAELWTRLLKSQGLTAIQESPDANLETLLQPAKPANESLPKLIIWEMSIETLNPYDFCRRVKAHYPSLKVILTAQQRIQVSETEQQWAIKQGAYHLLPGFDYAHLPLSLTQGIESVMAALENDDWERDSLFPVVDELTTEFGQREEKTVLQPAEAWLDQTPPTSGHKQQHLKVKPKVKRFRGLPY